MRHKEKSISKIENKTFCDNCSLKCIASDCDCVCHTNNGTFNYGYKQGFLAGINAQKKEELEFLEHCSKSFMPYEVLINQKIEKLKKEMEKIK